MLSLACTSDPTDEATGSLVQPHGAQGERRGYVTRRAAQISGDGRLDGMENVAEEVPVALVYNGISHAVMLATPMHLEDFAVGFSISEGIVDHRREVYDTTVQSSPLGLEVHVEIASARFTALKARRRTLAGRTGCGLCGVESLEAAVRHPTPVRDRVAISDAAVQRAMSELHNHQPLHALTGGTHAAAWVDRDGKILMAREDVGRHNALDKLIGALAHADIDPSSGFVAVTSRASYEMVQKVATYGISLLAAVSAPTAYAVRMAEEANVQLLAFARGSRFTSYT
jgi:FdhD protein